MDAIEYQGRYYYVTEVGRIEYEINRCEKSDSDRLSKGNFFKTAEEAKESKFYKFYHGDNKNKELELPELCMKVNKETKHTVFFSFRGHVQVIDIDIHINGYYSENELSKQYTAYLKEPENQQLNFTEWKSNNFETKNFYYYIEGSLYNPEKIKYIYQELNRLLGDKI